MRSLYHDGLLIHGLDVTDFKSLVPLRGPLGISQNTPIETAHPRLLLWRGSLITLLL
jgi:hypothetical protein